MARALTEARSGGRLTETGISVGTPAYMSPEQAAGERHIDASADVYALAVVGYEMLAGVPPFAGPTAQAVIAAHLTARPKPLTDVRPETPPLVANAIAGALAKDPNARLRTATEFRDALGATAYGLRSPRLLTKTARRGVVAALCVVVIAALGIVVSRRHRALVIPSASTIAVVPFAPSTPDSALTRLGRDAHGMVASMSKKGDCWDNAVAESFFATLETEVIMEAAWPTRAAARQAIFAYIETWPGTTGSGDTRASATAVPCSTGLLLVHVARAAITGLPDESKTMASRCQPKPTGNVSESGQTLTRATDVGRSLGSVAAGWGHSNRCTRR